MSRTCRQSKSKLIGNLQKIRNYAFNLWIAAGTVVLGQMNHSNPEPTTFGIANSSAKSLQGSISAHCRETQILQPLSLGQARTSLTTQHVRMQRILKDDMMMVFRIIFKWEHSIPPESSGKRSKCTRNSACQVRHTIVLLCLPLLSTSMRWKSKFKACLTVFDHIWWFEKISTIGANCANLIPLEFVFYS